MNERAETLARDWEERKVAVYERLVHHFADDLEGRDAMIDKDSLTMTFQDPRILFATNNVEISPRFACITLDFFPRYVTALSQFGDRIAEIRIEGHTSSEWSEVVTPLSAYFLNMRLSQDRTRSVLRFGIEALLADEAVRQWALRRLIAVGMSSSRLVMSDGAEDKERSRRAEFRVLTDAETRLAAVLDELLER